MARSFMLVVVVSLMPACANKALRGPGSGLQAGAANQAAISQTGPNNLDTEAALVRQKTVAAQVLTAIAIERVTGQKPDRIRLFDPN